MKQIAVYGSLRKGLGNHRIISGSELVSTEVVRIPYRMISLGGFPGLVPSKEESDITIEVYNVDDYTYQRVEWLESYPSFYQKDTIPTTQGDVEVYVLLHPSYQHYHTVESGDWVNYLKEDDD